MRITDFKVTRRDRREVCGTATFEDGVCVRFVSTASKTSFIAVHIPNDGKRRTARIERFAAVVDRINAS